ncbi:LysR family transcriptional regulator [Elioraea sp.]|uniref:LysR family transcriptional regulator n=1 Tax=Elioraea sp. TaxID=2185103 RepID=UPI003F6EA341
MPELNLNRIDLNLLTVFATLMEERSVTRAGQRLNLSQPATSGALNRLREVFRDPLFIRTGRAFEPTARALEIMERVGPALAAVQAALAPSIPFDPATDTRHFRIGCSDDAAIPLLPVLTCVLRREAPGCTLTVRHADYRSAPDLLASGDVSMVVGYVEDDLPANAKRRRLVEGHFVVLRADAGTEAIGLDEYCARPHALVTYRGDLSGVVDEELARMGRSRQVVLGLTDFALLPLVLAGTDMLATVPDLVAETLAAHGGLRIDPTPFPAPANAVLMAWRGATDGDPAERWLRHRIVESLRGPKA